MFNLFDYLVRIGESQREAQVERLTRMYPHLFEGANDENTSVTPAKATKNQKTLRTLNSSHSQTV